jgi:hypothetical protein
LPLGSFGYEFLNNPFSVKTGAPSGFAEKKSPHLAALGLYFFSQSLALKKGLRSGAGWYQKTGGSGRLDFLKAKSHENTNWQKPTHITQRQELHP